MILTGIEQDDQIAQFKAQCLGSLLFFTQVFFQEFTGKTFGLSTPISREAHQITISRALTKVFHLETLRQWMSLPPGHGKSTFLTYFIAWAYAHYADCNFMYISYSHELASSHTANIKNVMQLPLYTKLFGVRISNESSAKDDFKTTAGGRTKAFGSGGSITGMDAGFPNCDRFSGCVLMDDMHKPDDVFSDTMRESVISTYMNTIEPRPRSPNVAIIGIGQPLHEADIRNFLISGQDGRKWEHLKLPARDERGNVLAPNIINDEMLKAKEQFSEYVYWAQYMLEPRPAGGGIFKTDCFEQTEATPQILCTFLTVDTAESTKNYADHTVFSFWGIYKIMHRERATGEYGLHWIDCKQIKVEPAELEEELLQFYASCLGFKVQPEFIAIEKKSSGVTLLSVLKKMRGINLRDITRTAASGSKTARFLEAQHYVAKRLVSINKYAQHTDMCLKHMSKITANNTHAHDDIADTLYDAIKIALIDKSLISNLELKNNSVNEKLGYELNQQMQLRTNLWQG